MIVREKRLAESKAKYEAAYKEVTRLRGNVMHTLISRLFHIPHNRAREIVIKVQSEIANIAKPSRKKQKRVLMYEVNGESEPLPATRLPSGGRFYEVLVDVV